ncbi:hypothetical protein ACQR8F_23505, partial [Klebsiella pneumoniae]
KDLFIDKKMQWKMSQNSEFHAAAIGGFKQHAVRGGAGIQPRAVHLPDGGDVVGDLLLGRAQLPAAG